MAKKEEKVEKIEREYIIPLREKARVVPRYRKTEKVIKTIKEFIVRHMKIRDRDLKKVKIDGYLNEMIWMRGIRNPPHKIKVKAIKEGEIVRVEAVELPGKLKFKKAREERVTKVAKEKGEKKKAEKKVTEEAVKEKTEEEKAEEAEKKEEEKEKKAAVVETGKELEKAAAKQMKHQKIPKTKKSQHQRRMALDK